MYSKDNSAYIGHFSTKETDFGIFQNTYFVHTI